MFTQPAQVGQTKAEFMRGTEMRIATGNIDIKFSNMKSRVLISIGAFTLLAALASPIVLPAQENGEGKLAKFVMFDAPGAGSVGTFASSINPAGTITGHYADANGVFHGYVRASDGTVAEFDVPGAVPETSPSGINPAGTDTGYYLDANTVFHSYVRASDGTVTEFDAPGAGAQTYQGQGTYALSINPAGMVTGYYEDANDVNHSYARAPDGTITEFDAPGAGTGYTDGTFAMGINPAGTITGYYTDANFLFRSFMRSPDGAITPFDAPGAVTGTFAQSINPAGAITGSYGDANQGSHGFVRAPDGTFTQFDVPGAGTGYERGTLPLGINPAGTITGYYVDANGVNHGFVRAKDGTITAFDAPGAGAETDQAQGTFVQGINPAGAIAGYSVDANNVAHGFLRVP